MPAEIVRPIGVLVFASALLASCAGPARNAVLTADCLAAPNSSTPPGSHWYYRIDRTRQRKCWYLGTDSQTSEQKPRVMGEVRHWLQRRKLASYADPSSIESFKEFMAQRTAAQLSDQDVEKLYAEFVAWNRRAKN